MAKKTKKETTFAKTKKNDMRSNIVRFDWALKTILRDKANFGILEGFLSTLLGKTITIKELLDSESNKAHGKDKFNRVDVLAKDENGEILLFEFQNDVDNEFFHRLTYGISKTIVEHLYQGEQYAMISKVYAIGIVFYDLGDGKGYLYHGRMKFDNMNDSSDQLLLSDGQQRRFNCKAPGDIMPECYILRVNNFDGQVNGYLDEWVRFFKTEEADNDTKAPGLLEAKMKLNICMLTPEQRREYDNYIEDLRYHYSMVDSITKNGYINGFDDGEVLGRVKGIHEVAKRLKEQGSPLEFIHQVTGLPIEEIENL